jgi:hypothetical protein
VAAEDGYQAVVAEEDEYQTMKKENMSRVVTGVEEDRRWTVIVAEAGKSVKLLSTLVFGTVLGG